MVTRKSCCRSLLVVVLSVAASGELLAQATSDATGKAKLGVGLRRSSYGLRSKNGDDAWWVDRAKQYAAAFPGAEPMIVEIVSGYQGRDGSTQFGFEKPAAYDGPTDFMSFNRGALDHERALSLYDEKGVKAIIQFEPGDADMLRCIELANLVFGKHKCIVGYGIDAEWYRTKHSGKQEGVPVPDAEAKSWTEKVVSLRPDYTFFLKHFDTKHLPPTYRHPQLWFLDDSQQFANRGEMMDDFKGWAKACQGSATGYQFGYPDDRKWWSQLGRPPLELGRQIRDEIPSCRYLFWVDFSADKVQFSEQP